ncbi:MAG TPA: NADH-quinone oxidoreductase subunit K [Patescibacteria group bacterium]|nr:NADH-quinone oxidoreductase subunit K [Patescibacteria group bacterium]
MSNGVLGVLWPFSLFIIMLSVVGLYCVLVTRNLIRALIGLELLFKAVTLLLVTVGYVTYHAALAQALVITLIVIEVVVMTVAVGVVLGIRSYNESLDTRRIRNLKG